VSDPPAAADPTEDQIIAAFLDALAVGESADVDGEPIYNELYGGAHFSDYSQFPDWPGVRTKSGSMTHAAGRYQFEPSTWRDEQTRMRLPDFSPDSQDAGAWDLAETVYKRMTSGGSLLDDLTAGITVKVAPALRRTWTSLGDSFSGRYRVALVDVMREDGQTEADAQIEPRTAPVAMVVAPQPGGLVPGASSGVSPAPAPAIAAIGTAEKIADTIGVLSGVLKFVAARL